MNSILRERGITQLKLAERLGVHWRTVSDWVTGKKKPSLESVALLAAELKVSLKTIFLALKIDVSGIPDDLPEDVEEE